MKIVCPETTALEAQDDQEPVGFRLLDDGKNEMISMMAKIRLGKWPSQPVARLTGNHTYVG